MTFVAIALAAFIAQPAPQAPAHTGHAGHAGHAGHTASAAPAAAPAATRFSTATSKIADLLANPAAKAAIETVLPGFSSHPQIGMAGQFTLKAIQGMTQGAITDAHLEAIDRAFAAIPAA